ncbi:MAG: hypothetical protein Aurels2KO_22470 [Aureliella sp.]
MDETRYPPQFQFRPGSPHMDHKISISATFSAAPVAVCVRAWCAQAGEAVEVKVLPFNQVFQSLLAVQQTGLMVVTIRWEDWTDGVEDSRLADTIDSRRAELFDAIKRYHTSTQTPVFLVFSPHSPNAPPELIKATSRAESKLLDQFSDIQVDVVRSDQSFPPDELVEFSDPVALKTGHVPYTAQYFSVLGHQIAREYFRLAARPIKAIVVDADNTLWDGVCGEDAASEIRVTSGHTALQRRLLALRERGILLCLCSKNEPADVWTTVENSSGMLLSQSDFTTHRVNWSPKSENIRAIASELNLHPSSFLFLDDSPIECGEVRAACPETLTLQIPSSEQLAEFVDLAWPLDLPATTREDRLRVASYDQQRLRSASMQQSSSVREFLENLELEVAFSPLSRDNAARAAQLMQRTNQFNLTGKKATATELLDGQKELKIAVSAEDKFGEYGIVGLALGHTSSKTLEIDGLWLSCRALGRGVEFEILKRIAQTASDHRLDHVRLVITATNRNTPAQHFVEYVATRFGGEKRSIDNGTTAVELTTSSLTELSALDCAADSIASGKQSLESRERITHSDRSQKMQQIITASRSVDAMHQFILTCAAPRPEPEDSFIEPSTKLEKSVCEICAEALHLQKVGLDDSLEALGGSSLQTVQIHSRLVQQLGSSLSITQLYALATIRDIVSALTTELTDASHSAVKDLPSASSPPSTKEPIAVIGMAGRFPGASNIREFWDNLAAGRSSIVDIDDADLNLPHNSPLRQNPNLVRRAAGLENVSGFDAKFFKIYPKEAAVMDPQHRLLLESSWLALEDAGYIPDQIDSRVGVYAGCYMNTYMLASLTENPTLVQSLADSFHGGDLHTELGNDKDYLATRIAYLLNLRGPAMTIQTACSTSLVAIANACENLRNNQCDFALAGGATLKLPQNRGYLYTDGGMVSPDGVVRTFDADARGTVFGEGVGVVVLRRLSDALRDQDDIYAVIRGCGVNNDGRQKMGYAAPSVDGQAAAISLALDDAGVPAETITYVEAHGTGTSLGDPIEVDALSRAYRRHSQTNTNQYCAIGSVKTNIGHLDVAAGVTGLIKVCLAMRHEQLPPSLNYSRANPNIDFENSPFFVNTQLRPWKPSDQPLRAGLSSFGVGGTNAHVIIEQPQARPTKAECSSLGDEKADSSPTLLTWSAASEPAVQEATENLREHLQSDKATSLSDVAFTLARSRKTLNYTAYCVAHSRDEAIDLLARRSDLPTTKQVRRGIPTTWFFPGQGAQHPSMASDLYRELPQFRKWVDRCSDILLHHLPFAISDYLRDPEPGAEQELGQTSIAQPAIFTVSYALSKCLMDLGIQPARMVGHSVGEFVAATLAGVFTLEDALGCVAFRGQAMQELPAGEMLAVRASADHVELHLHSDLDLAAINSPKLCVVAGPTCAIQEFASFLESEGITSSPLHTSHAFHSRMMQPVVAALEQHISGLSLQPASISIISTLTGRTLTDVEATSASYWAQHCRETVRFSDAAARALGAGNSVMLEVGPGQTLSTLVKQCQAGPDKHKAMSLLPHAKQSCDAYAHLLGALGKLWQSGVDFDRSGLVLCKDPRRVHLPGYPFQHEHHWLDSIAAPHDEPPEQGTPLEVPPVAPPDQPNQREATTARTQPPPADVVHQVVNEQLDVMTRQLKAWRG